MEQIIIRKDENGTFSVEQGNKVAAECNWEEMMGLLASLTIPEKKPCLGYMRPKKESYEPKDGDFVYVKTNRCREIVFIKNKNIHHTTEAYIYFILENGYLLNAEKKFVYFDKIIDNIRPATEEEKQLLLDALHEAGKDWDAENKQIVDYKWKPKEGEGFFYCSYGVVDDSMCFCPRMGKYITDENDDDFDCEAFVAPDYSKCFKIDEEKECQEYCDKLNEAIRNVK